MPLRVFADNLVFPVSRGSLDLLALGREGHRRHSITHSGAGRHQVHAALGKLAAYLPANVP